MSAAEEPWGFIITGTLHLFTGDFNRPACGNLGAIGAIARVRRSWDNGGTAPLFGGAGRRPVCRQCIAAARRQAQRLTEVADQAEAWYEARP